MNHVLSSQADPRNSDGETVCQNPHPAISFQDVSSQNIYFYHLYYNVKMMSERIAVVRVPCMVILTPAICMGVAGFTLISALFI